MVKRITQIAKHLVGQSLTNDQIDPAKVALVLEGVKQTKASGAVAILKAYQHFLAQKLAVQTAIIEVSQEPSATLKTQIETEVKAKFPPVMDFQFRVDPKLIGGLRITIADMVYEQSIHGTLESLRSH